MSAEHTFKQELQSLDTLKNEIEEKADELRDFIASDEFLQDPIKFERLFGKFQAKITIATGFAETYLPVSVLNAPILPRQTPENQAKTTETTEETETSHGWGLSIGKVIVAVAALALCYAAVYMEWIPEQVFVWFLVGTITLMFLPATLSLIPKLVQHLRTTEKEEEFKSLAKRLKEINDTLTEMNRLYEYHYWKVKTQSYVGTLARYERLGKSEELYVPAKQAPRFLLFDFSEKINWVIRECNDTIWSRKITIAMAIVEVGKPAPTYGRGGFGAG